MTDEEVIMAMGEVYDSQIMGLNYLNEIDVDVCKYVIGQIPSGIDIKKLYLGNSISFDEIIYKSLDEIKVFGDEFRMNIKNSLSRVVFDKQEDDLFAFSTYIVYSLDEDDQVCLDSGRIDGYKIFKKLYEFSVFYLTHEHLHALKDINYYEYVNSLVLGEVIPLFYEMMIFNPDDVLKLSLIKSRLYHLNDGKDLFLSSNEYFNSAINMNEKVLSDYIRSKSGCYFNSFYYAVILYNVYKETPKKILDLVSKVLRHEITTLQMLELLGIYGDIRGEVFESELGAMKRILKI